MKSLIQFFVTHDGGVYTASAMNAPIITQGDSFEELQDNIREAVSLYLEEEGSTVGFASTPTIMTNFEIQFDHVS